MTCSSSMFQCDGESKITCITMILGAPWIWPWNINLLPFFFLMTSVHLLLKYGKWGWLFKIWQRLKNISSISKSFCFVLCFLSFDCHSYFSLVKKLKLVMHCSVFYLLGISSFVIHFCFTFSTTNCALNRHSFISMTIYSHPPFLAIATMENSSSKINMM